MKSVEVQHFVMAYQVRSERAVPRYTLFGVDPKIQVPSDKEFPRRIPSLDLFARIRVLETGVYEFRIRVQCEGTGAKPLTRATYQYERSFLESDPLVDTCFRLVNLELTQHGWHTMSLAVRRPNPSWKGGQRWVRLATEYFFVEKLR